MHRPISVIALARIGPFHARAQFERLQHWSDSLVEPGLRPVQPILKSLDETTPSELTRE